MENTKLLKILSTKRFLCPKAQCGVRLAKTKSPITGQQVMSLHER